MNILTKMLLEAINEGQDLEGKCTDTVLVSKDGKILLIRRPENDNLFPNQWCLPGGHRQDDETILDGAKRETREETGIDCKSLNRLWKWTYPDGFETVFFYGIEGEDFDKTDVKLSDEHIDFLWAEPEQALSMNLSGTLKEPLSKIIDTLFTT